MDSDRKQRFKNREQMKTIIKNKIQHTATLGAEKLKKQAEKLSPVQQKIAVIIFCLLCSAVSTGIIIKTILLKTPDTILIHHHIIPAHIGKTNTPHPHFSILPEDFERVELVKKYLDSVAVADTIKYKAIMKQSPHLLDTINLFEKIYKSQSKK
jgi:hypothetical protein